MRFKEPYVRAIVSLEKCFDDSETSLTCLVEDDHGQLSCAVARIIPYPFFWDEEMRKVARTLVLDKFVAT